jgi:pre-mRNA-processing factor 19
VTSAIFHPTHPAVVTTSLDSTALLWAASGNEYTVNYKVGIHTSGVSGASFHPAGRYFATASLDGSWALNDIDSSKTICHVPEKQSGTGYRCVEFHPDGLILGTGTMVVGDDAQAKNRVRIWDMKNSSNVATFEGHSQPVTNISFSENGYYLATASEDCSVRICDLRKLTNFKTLEIGSPVSSVSFDHSGCYLAVAAADLRVYNKTWDCILTQTAHTAELTGVGFGPNARYIASTSMDQSLKFYGRN